MDNRFTILRAWRTSELNHALATEKEDSVHTTHYTNHGYTPEEFYAAIREELADRS